MTQFLFLGYIEGVVQPAETANELLAAGGIHL